MKIIKIYTDGGLSESIGAAAFVILDKKNKVITESVTTYNDGELDNNKFELIAIINSLNWLRSNGFSPKTHRIYVYTDHQATQLGLCVNLLLWKENNWKANIKFKSLWKYLSLLIDSEFKSIHVQWLPKSAENKWHKRADELCTIAMKDFKTCNIEVECLTKKTQLK